MCTESSIQIRLEQVLKLVSFNSFLDFLIVHDPAQRAAPSIRGPVERHKEAQSDDLKAHRQVPLKD
jgi:hypothetical protein